MPAKVPMVLFHHPLWWLMPSGSGVAVTLVVLVALAVVAPLPLAARYPLLAWRIGWLALLGVPLLGIYWQGNWPWDPVQLLVLLVVFCVAGGRHRRPVLCWMWVPWPGCGCRPGPTAPPPAGTWRPLHRPTLAM